MWNLLNDELDADIEREQLLDFYQRVETLAPAAKVLFGADDADKNLQRWKLRLLNTDRAAKGILRELVDSGREHIKVDGEYPVHDAITYLRNNMDKMRYATAKARGLPIGTGTSKPRAKLSWAFE